MKFLMVIFIVFIFTACSQERTQPLYSVKLSDTGVGKIKVGTPFEMRLIEPKFPGFEIQKFTFFKEGEPMQIIQIGYREVPWMYLFPSKDKKLVKNVSIVTNKIKTSWPTKIGMRFDKTYHAEQLSLCKLGSDALKGNVVCSEPLAKNIYYVYKDETTLLGDELPRYTELKMWVLDEIIWSAR